MNSKGIPIFAGIVYILISIAVITVALTLSPTLHVLSKGVDKLIDGTTYASEALFTGGPDLGGNWNLDGVQNCDRIDMREVCTEYLKGKGWLWDSGLVNTVQKAGIEPQADEYCKDTAGRFDKVFYFCTGGPATFSENDEDNVINVSLKNNKFIKITGLLTTSEDFTFRIYPEKELLGNSLTSAPLSIIAPVTDESDLPPRNASNEEKAKFLVKRFEQLASIVEHPSKKYGIVLFMSPAVLTLERLKKKYFIVVPFLAFSETYAKFIDRQMIEKQSAAATALGGVKEKVKKAGASLLDTGLKDSIGTGAQTLWYGREKMEEMKNKVSVKIFFTPYSANVAEKFKVNGESAACEKLEPYSSFSEKTKNLLAESKDFVMDAYHKLAEKGEPESSSSDEESLGSVESKLGYCELTLENNRDYTINYSAGDGYYEDSKRVPQKASSAQVNLNSREKSKVFVKLSFNDLQKDELKIFDNGINITLDSTALAKKIVEEAETGTYYLSGADWDAFRNDPSKTGKLTIKLDLKEVLNKATLTSEQKNKLKDGVLVFNLVKTKDSEGKLSDSPATPFFALNQDGRKKLIKALESTATFQDSEYVGLFRVLQKVFETSFNAEIYSKVTAESGITQDQIEALKAAYSDRFIGSQKFDNENDALIITINATINSDNFVYNQKYEVK